MFKLGTVASSSGGDGEYSATMTVGSLIVGGDYGSETYGFNDGTSSAQTSATFGSLSDRDVSPISNSGATVECLAHFSTNGTLRLDVTDDTAVANSGWSTLTTGSTSFSRTDAAFVAGTGGQGNRGTWSWTTSNPLGTSGTILIEIS